MGPVGTPVARQVKGDFLRTGCSRSTEAASESNSDANADQQHSLETSMHLHDSLLLLLVLDEQLFALHAGFALQMAPLGLSLGIEFLHSFASRNSVKPCRIASFHKGWME